MESISDNFAEEPKKLKIAAEEPNMDPFKLPFDIHYLIYQHLTGKEVLTMSEVSPAWYTDIGNSSVCINKIKFNFVLKKGTQIENPTELIETKRQHKNVVVHWEHARMNLPNRTKVIETFASSVVDLEIRAISNLVWEPVALPKLKTLVFEMRYENRLLVSPSFMNVIGQCNLENLIVNGRVLLKNPFNIIKNQLSSLKMLSLEHDYNSLVFGDRNVAILHHLKLTKLKITPINHHVPIVSSFLKSQADTLEHLILCSAENQMLKVVLECPKLQILEISIYFLRDTEWSTIPTSSSIVDVKISFYCRWPQNISRNLLKRVPNLKQLTIDCPYDSDCLLIISENAMKLENLYYFSHNYHLTRERYEAIKQNPNIIINRQIQLKPAVGQLLKFTL